MYTILVETEFSASHQLTMYDGKKEDMHCHQWQLTAAVCSEKLDRIGLVMDFHELKRLIQSVIGPISGKKIEEIEFFHSTNASAENVASYIYDQLKSILPKMITLDYVEITEAPGCKVRYSR